MNTFSKIPQGNGDPFQAKSFFPERSGFSLLEVVIAIGLFCLLLSASLQLWRTVQQHIQHVAAQQEMVENAMGIASHIRYEFKLSSRASYQGESTEQGIETSQIELERPYWANGIMTSKKIVLFKEPETNSTQGQIFYISKTPGSKYEAGVYLRSIYVQELGNNQYLITLEMKYRSYDYRHTFSAHLMDG